MPRLASILFATIVITLGGEQLQSAEFDVLQAESAADPFLAGPPPSVPKKPEQAGIAEPPVGRVSCEPENASVAACPDPFPQSLRRRLGHGLGLNRSCPQPLRLTFWI